MYPQFFEISGRVVNAEHIVCVDLRKEDIVTVSLSNGNTIVTEGPEAKAVARFFSAAPPAAPPSAPPSIVPATPPAPPAPPASDEQPAVN